MQRYFKTSVNKDTIDGLFPGTIHKLLFQIIVITISFLISTLSISANKKSTVAIMDFSTGDIPQKYKNIIRNEIEYNFYKSNDFIVLEREKIDIIAKEKSIKNAGLEKRSVLLSMGKTLSADYILTGNIEKDKTENKYKAILRIINVSDGVILYAYSRKFNETADIIELTKSFSERAITDIVYYNTYGKLRDTKETGRKEENTEAINISKADKKTGQPGKSANKKIELNFALLPEFVYPLGNFKESIRYGYGIKLYIGMNDLFLNNISLGLEAGFLKLDSKKNKDHFFTAIPLLLNIGYMLNIYESLFICPEIKTGAVYLSSRSSNDNSTKDNDDKAFEIMSQAGLMIGKRINSHTEIAISSGYGVYFEEKNNIYFLAFNLGAYFSF